MPHKTTIPLILSQSFNPDTATVNTHHLGTITTVHTTPPSITILPDSGGPILITTELSHTQLENLLLDMSLGSAQVSYTLREGPYGFYATDVQSTGFVDEERWRRFGMQPGGMYAQERKRDGGKW